MKSTPKNVLIIRMSALGDVAMTIPVICSLKKQYPDAKITMLSKPFVKPLFDKIGVNFIGIERKKGSKNIFDLIRFFNKIRRVEKWDVVIDLHDVIISKVLKFLFRLHGVKVVVLHKGRNEKNALVSPKRKILRQLPSTFDRYSDTCRRSNLPIDLTFETLYPEGKEALGDEIESITGAKNCTWIGIAPFAQHQGKIYPLDKMVKVASHFCQTGKYKILLFGGGNQEIEALSKLEKEYPNTISLAGKFGLEQEVRIMSHLDAMISMDSANMHLASLSAVPVVSIWGATHPYAGFYGYRQPVSNIVQIDMPCRPCSIYGNKECMWGDYRCMTQITPEQIIERVKSIIE